MVTGAGRGRAVLVSVSVNFKSIDRDSLSRWHLGMSVRNYLDYVK